MRSEGYGSWVCLSVCLCVCLSVTRHLTSRVFVRLTKDTTYWTGNEGQKFRTVFKATARKSQYANTQRLTYYGMIDPRALRTSEAPEDATQGVYHLSHAI